LVDIASKGGNYLLNVGPKPDGTFPQESIGRLKDISDWMKVNSEAIYATKPSPIDPVAWGRCTRKDSKKGTTLYVSVFDWPTDGKLVIPDLDHKVISAKLLDGNVKLKTSFSKEKGLTINVPKEAPDKVASVIKIEVKGKMGTRFSDAAKKMKTGELD
jgi:alpha-L-fucosidase